MARSVVVRWSSGLAFEGTSGSGGQVAMSGDEADDGLRPTEALLAALAACTGMDVVAICAKKRQAIASYEVHVTGSQRDSHPRIFERIEVEHRFTGTAVDEIAVLRSIELSASRYCPVSASLATGLVEIRHRYTIADGTGERTGDAITVGPLGEGLRPV